MRAAFDRLLESRFADFIGEILLPAIGFTLGILLVLWALAAITVWVHSVGEAVISISESLRVIAESVR